MPRSFDEPLRRAAVTAFGGLGIFAAPAEPAARTADAGGQLEACVEFDGGARGRLRLRIDAAALRELATVRAGGEADPCTREELLRELATAACSQVLHDLSSPLQEFELAPAVVADGEASAVRADAPGSAVIRLALVGGLAELRLELEDAAALETRRGDPRVASDLEVDVRDAAGEERRGTLVDLGLGGARLRVAAPFAAGSACFVTIWIGGRERGIPLPVQARVLRADPHGMAVGFTEVPAAARRCLEQIVVAGAGAPV
jgi:hypothetical protein